MRSKVRSDLQPIVHTTTIDKATLYREFETVKVNNEVINNHKTPSPWEVTQKVKS